MRSASSLSITWRKPDLIEERWEFDYHPDKQDFYRRHTLTWHRLSSAFATGSLIPYPRAATLNSRTVEGSFSSYDDYSRYLARAKRGYRHNYTRMEGQLQREGGLELPAAIILQGAESSLLFSGYRRLCLAWNYGMTPYVWLVPLHEPAA